MYVYPHNMKHLTLHKGLEVSLDFLDWCTPSSLLDSIASPKVKTTKGEDWGVFFGSQHFKGRRAC
jgi:hypothetical protein